MNSFYSWNITEVSEKSILLLKFYWIGSLQIDILLPTLTVSLFLLEYYQLSPNLYFDEKFKMAANKTQPPKSNDKLPQYTDDNVSSQISRLCLPLNLFCFAFYKFHENSQAGLHIAQYKLIHSFLFHICKKGYQFSFMIVLIAKCISTRIKNTTKLQPCHFHNCPLFFTIDYQWIPKVHWTLLLKEIIVFLIVDHLTFTF